MHAIVSLLNTLISEHKLLELQVNTPRDRSPTALIKIAIWPWVDSAGNLKYCVDLFFKNNSNNKHLLPSELTEYVVELLTSTFRQALIHTKDACYHILINRKGFPTILKKKSTKKDPSIQLQHNRSKNYLLCEGNPIPFLIALGVMDSQGKIYPKKYDKFRQINRYLEIITDLLPALTSESTSLPFRIIDFGCGKSYLTFALYYYLVQQLQLPIEIIGLDLKQEVIDGCIALAKQLGYHHLSFVVGNAKDYQTSQPVDMVISLHACNTATDIAIAKAIAWQAKVIVAVPCCHQELMHQINNSSLQILLKHGILRERFAAMVTDAMRAQLLEIHGYKSDVVEFIDMEHTPKNILIRAVRCINNSNNSNKIEEYQTLRQMVAAAPLLEKLLRTCLHT